MGSGSSTGGSDSNRGTNYGWTGLIGLVGLAGLMRKNRQDTMTDTRATR